MTQQSTATAQQQALAVPERVAVLGGGRMGGGIAQVFARAGARVVVLERDQQAAEAAAARLDDGLAKAAKHEPALDVTAVRERLRVVVEAGELVEAQLVVEAVPEDMGMKVEALTSAESATGGKAVMATNTSSLSVDVIASHLAAPNRLLGLHFFNPVPPSALVEIVRGEATDESLVHQARGWVEALGKTPIVVRNAPGFASSRLGNALALEAMRMVEEGVASPADIDAAMELGYRHETGPLRTSDLVGLDVRLGIAEYLHQTLGERFAPPQILRDKVARGELGRKSGKGFYDYSA